MSIGLAATKQPREMHANVAAETGEHGDLNCFGETAQVELLPVDLWTRMSNLTAATTRRPNTDVSLTEKLAAATKVFLVSD